MAERTAIPADDTIAEAIATTGLFLNITAVIAIAVSLASWVLGDGAIALVSGVIAAGGFVASIACFRTQSDERDLHRATRA